MPTSLKRLIKKLFGIDEDEDDNNFLAGNSRELASLIRDSRDLMLRLR